MRATFAVPAVIAHIHCDLVRSLAAEGHEIAAHGFRHWIRPDRPIEAVSNVGRLAVAGE
jgi:peptidoglycan/xylan/chitin deacetylase (PgdA/CDA1 family)